MSDENLELGKGSDPLQSSDSAPAPIISPGKILAARRQELNWTVEDVAHSLHLAPRQVHAIEDDNYGALPGVAITRGFIRSYAKLLKLDPAPLLEKIGQDASYSRTEDASLRRALPAKPFYAHRSLSRGSRPRSRIWIAVLAIFCLLLAGLFMAWKSGWLSSKWIADTEELFRTNSETDKAGEPKSGLSVPRVATVSTNTQDDTQAPLPNRDLSNLSAQSSPQSSAVQVASAADSLPAPAIPEQKDMLVLRLREDSWIEIRSGQNKVLVSRLAKAGEIEAIPVNEPLKLTIGNAAGVDAQLRGIPVELNASAKSNVARITVN